VGVPGFAQAIRVVGILGVLVCAAVGGGKLVFPVIHILRQLRTVFRLRKQVPHVVVGVAHGAVSGGAAQKAVGRIVAVGGGNAVRHHARPVATGIVDSLGGGLYNYII